MHPEISKTIERATRGGLGFVDSLPGSADDSEFGWQQPAGVSGRTSGQVPEVGRLSSGGTDYVLVRRAGAREHVLVFERPYWEMLATAIRAGEIT